MARLEEGEEGGSTESLGSVCEHHCEGLGHCVFSLVCAGEEKGKRQDKKDREA